MKAGSLSLLKSKCHKIIGVKFPAQTKPQIRIVKSRNMFKINSSSLSVLLFSILLLALSFNVRAQKVIDGKLTAEKFENEKYESALKDYLVLIKKEPKNEFYLYRIAICYLFTNINKTLAIPYLETLSHNKKCDPEVWYWLGRAYHQVSRFDDAIACYNKYKSSGKEDSEFLSNVDLQIDYCKTANELMKFPLDVKFENLGKNINSPFPDYFPFVPGDESFIVFNSRRSQGALLEGADNAGIYISKVNNGAFGKAKSIGPPINTNDGDEEVIGLSNSGDIMLLYYDNLLGFGDIYLSVADKKQSFKKAVMLNQNINSPDEEISASISADGNILYFASNRPGGKGSSDIYMSKKLPNGSWGVAQNLGDEINTTEEEDFPNISPDGKTLYFSSKGHTGMGGYDIFKANWDESSEKWINPKNIGYPINTVDDNLNFRVSETGKFGYISALMDGGFGDLDIYRVTFSDMDSKFSVIKGFISSLDTVKRISFSDVAITLSDAGTHEIFGQYLANEKSGKFVMIAPPGNYELEIEASGFQKFSEKINLFDKSSFKAEIDREVKLSPVGYKVTVPGTKKVKK